MNVSAGARARIRAQDALTDGLENALFGIADAIETRLSALLRSDGGTTNVDDLQPFEAVLASIRSIATNPEATRIAMLAIELAEIESWLDAIGLGDARAKYFGGFASLASPIADALEAAGVPGASSLLDREGIRVAVEAFSNNQDGLLFGGIKRDAAVRISQSIQANAELLTDAEFAQRISETFEDGIPAAKTQAVTRLAEADRFIAEQLVREAESDGFEMLRGYAGPLDAKTRPFCSALVGKAFSLEELEAANNGQIGSPITSGGGYNCRHLLEAVPAEMVEGLGFSRGTPADIQAANGAAQRSRKGRRRRRAA